MSYGHPNSLANLKPFKLGSVANPVGRPRGQNGQMGYLSGALKRIGRRRVTATRHIAKIAVSVGLDPKAIKNINLVGELVYAALIKQLVMAAEGSPRVDAKILIDLLYVLFNALEKGEGQAVTRIESPTAMLAHIHELMLGGQVAHDGNGNGQHLPTLDAVPLVDPPSEVA